jgi:hypothetical protein
MVDLSSKNKFKHPYRVFISYSHDDIDKAAKVDEILKKNGLIPMWDSNLSPGHGFSDEIKNFIINSHVFLPLVTKKSMEGGWVHQEIGFSTAMNIPTLPVMLEEQVPQGMIGHLHAVKYADKDLQSILSWEIFNNLVKKAECGSTPYYELASNVKKRTEMIIKYSRNILKLGEDDFSGEIRQISTTSSFNLPLAPPNAQIWDDFFDGYFDEELFDLLRKERKILTKHAERKGCKLIINPSLAKKNYNDSYSVKIKELIKFIKEFNGKLNIIIDNKNLPRNITIVGDYFVAESINAPFGKGYQQTIFTRHAPTVKDRIHYFDLEYDYLLKESYGGTQPAKEDIIKELLILLKN